MEQIERLNDQKSTKSYDANSASKLGRFLVEIASDDRCVRMNLDGCMTVDQVKCRAIEEMQLPVKNPERYIVIGADLKRVEDQLSINKILAAGQALEFRLIPQVAFGWKKLLMPLLRVLKCLTRS
jgi:hypothetical protein